MKPAIKKEKDMAAAEYTDHEIREMPEAQARPLLIDRERTRGRLPPLMPEEPVVPSAINAHRFPLGVGRGYFSEFYFETLTKPFQCP